MNLIKYELTEIREKRASVISPVGDVSQVDRTACLISELEETQKSRFREENFKSSLGQGIFHTPA